MAEPSRKAIDLEITAGADGMHAVLV